MPSTSGLGSRGGHLVAPSHAAGKGEGRGASVPRQTRNTSRQGSSFLADQQQTAHFLQAIESATDEAGRRQLDLSTSTPRRSTRSSDATTSEHGHTASGSVSKAEERHARNVSVKPYVPYQVSPEATLAEITRERQSSGAPQSEPLVTDIRIEPGAKFRARSPYLSKPAERDSFVDPPTNPFRLDQASSGPSGDPRNRSPHRGGSRQRDEDVPMPDRVRPIGGPQIVKMQQSRRTPAPRQEEMERDPSGTLVKKKSSLLKVKESIGSMVRRAKRDKEKESNRQGR